MSLNPSLTILSQQLGQALKTQNWQLVTAESCTGGWVAEAITAVPGSSSWFDRGFVTYSNIAKQEMLGVKAQTLAQYGAVSEQTAKEMAEGAIAHSQANIAVAITGIAGPDGGSLHNPVGTVWLAWAGKSLTTLTQLYHFHGDRYTIRLHSVQQALKGLIHLCQL